MVGPELIIFVSYLHNIVEVVMAVQAKFAYTPLLESEQEVLNIMVSDDQFYVEVEGYGFYPSPRITHGDKRVCVRFPFEFTRPAVISPVYELTLVLRFRQDQSEVYRATLPTIIDYQPLQVSKGLQLDLVWDISIGSLSESFMKKAFPGFKGKEMKRISGG